MEKQKLLVTINPDPTYDFRDYIRTALQEKESLLREELRRNMQKALYGEKEMEEPKMMIPEPVTDGNFPPVERSRSIKWNKKNEMVVLKGKIYRITNVAPKKLTLKIYATAPKDLEDGVYSLKEVAEELKK